MKHLFDGAFFPQEIFTNYALKNWLRASGVTQHTLASALGSTQSVVSLIASRKRSPSLLDALKVAHIAKDALKLEDMLSAADLLKLEEFKGGYDL